MEEKKAAALRFRPGEDKAPRIVASGKGALADEIIERARESSVPVLERSELAGFLLDLPVGQEIPENLYRAVSTVFARLLQLEGEVNEKTQGS
jgi:flagellar biosynthesis protein